MLGDSQRGANSLNHNRASQNVGVLDGHADWFETTKIPGTQPLNNDNALDDIYQSAGNPADDTNGRRGAINDAFLIP